ncbi:MAG: alpha/beta hydrolase [Terriglobales bacterium]|jgi:pimeloyl-ACP methyl ester carboxylesterase
MASASVLPPPVRRFAKLRRWTKRFLLGILALLLLAVIAGACYQYFEVTSWAKASPPGRLAQVDGVPTHIYCMGIGNPTVVLVSGLGGDWSDWGFVLHDVAAITRVCAYDRAGLGWSAATPAARTSRNIAAELEATLNAAGEKGPYILVGHSIGGLHIREYQAQHPDRVVGMLFLDSSYPGQTQRLPEWQATIPGKRRYFRTLTWLSYLAEPRVSGLCTTLAPKYPAQFRDAALATAKRSCDSTLMRTIVDELDGFQLSQDQVSSDSKSLDSLPVTVISHDPDKPIADLSPEINRRTEATWAEMQMELTELSSRGKHLVAKGSGHYVQMDRPDLVISSIHDVVEQCRLTP